MRVFVDTNVLLDVLAHREPFFAAAVRIWSLAERGDVDAFVSAFSYNNVYYIVRKVEGKARANTALHLIRDVFSPVAPDRRILDQALDSGLDDFEDAVQYYSASRVRAAFLITRDPDDFPRTPLRVVSPQEFLVLRAG